MATNQYLPFATGGGANVLAFSAYSSLAARTAGFSAGTALSAQLNTVWRQASVAAAMLGQFVADVGGFDALDDGSISNLQTSFERTLQSGNLNYAVATGAANAIVISPTPVPAAYVDGLSFIIKAIASNPGGGCTLQVGTLAAVPLTRTDGTPLQANDIVPGFFRATYNSSISSFQVAGVGGAVAPIKTGAQFSTPGTTSWVCPAGVVRVHARVWGGGGGGGGGFSNTASPGAGAGGSGGGYAEGYFDVVPGTSYPVTVGSPGSGGGSPLNGTAGGSSSFGSFISATGGAGGAGGNNSATGPTGSPGIGTGGIFNYQGNFGAGGGTVAGSSTVIAGGGGGSFGSSNSYAVNNTSPGVFPGGAGGGGAVPANGGGVNGGNGASGFVILEW